MSDSPNPSVPPNPPSGADSTGLPSETGATPPLQANLPAGHAGAAASEAKQAPDPLLSRTELDALLASAGAPPEPEDDPRQAAGAGSAVDDRRRAGTSGSSPHPLDPSALPRFDPERREGRGIDAIDMLLDVNLQVTIELGRTRMLVEDVLKLGEGSVVELDRLAGDPVDIYANERLIARGEILVLNDNFCVRVSEVLTTDPHRIGSAS